MRSAPTPHAPDGAWFERTVSCNNACPVHTNAAGYVQAVADGRLADAYDIARARNPFPSICGRVCSAPCERACRRQVIDAPIAIRALKRVVTTHFGVEADDLSRWHRAHGAVPPVRRPSVGIVGAGPAGLAAAYELRLAGHAVTVYEADREPGGMLLTGIPAFRLPREVVRAEISALLSIGIELVTSCRIGVEMTLDELRATHAAVLLTVGCARGRALHVEGSELNGVVRAVDMLRAFNAGTFAQLQAPVLVIGGGSVAFDAARAAVRATSQSVTLVAPEANDALPVPREEVHEASREGVIVRAATGVRRIAGDGRVGHVVVAPVRSLFDAVGRFKPVLQEGRDETLAARTVVIAVGQESDVSFVDSSLGLRTSPWGGVVVDRDGRTSHARLYAAGDVSTGPRDLIDALAAGQRVARTIRADLSCASTWLAAARAISPIEADAPPMPMRPAQHQRRYWSGYDVTARRSLPTLPPQERAHDDEVEKLLGLVDARVEASRCLHCDVHVMLDAARCVACGLCVDVCPYGCIALTRAGQSSSQVDATVSTFALTLDERACIRCGLCVDRCPADALALVGV